MKFSTTNSTTYFFASISFIIQSFKADFSPLLMREGGYIGGLYAPI